jgi:hypothetical protein
VLQYNATIAQLAAANGWVYVDRTSSWRLPLPPAPTARADSASGNVWTRDRPRRRAIQAAVFEHLPVTVRPLLQTSSARGSALLTVSTVGAWAASDRELDCRCVNTKLRDVAGDF